MDLNKLPSQGLGSVGPAAAPVRQPSRSGQARRPARSSASARSNSCLGFAAYRGQRGRGDAGGSFGPSRGRDAEVFRSCDRAHALSRD